MCRARSAKLYIDRRDSDVVAYVDVDVDPYPWARCLIEVSIVVDGEIYDTKTYECLERGVVRYEFVLPNIYGAKVYAVARGRTGRMYPDDFIKSLRPVSKYGYTFYPVIYVFCRGGTSKPKYITSKDAFMKDIAEWFWSYDWIYTKVIKWEVEPLEYPKGYNGLKYVEWEGKFIYMINSDCTTEYVKSSFYNYMVGRWELESTECYACIDSVYAKQW